MECEERKNEDGEDKKEGREWEGERERKEERMEGSKDMKDGEREGGWGTQEGREGRRERERGKGRKSGNFINCISDQATHLIFHFISDKPGSILTQFLKKTFQSSVRFVLSSKH